MSRGLGMNQPFPINAATKIETLRIPPGNNSVLSKEHINRFGAFHLDMEKMTAKIEYDLQ